MIIYHSYMYISQGLRVINSYNYYTNVHVYVPIIMSRLVAGILFPN